MRFFCTNTGPAKTTNVFVSSKTKRTFCVQEIPVMFGTKCLLILSFFTSCIFGNHSTAPADSNTPAVRREWRLPEHQPAPPPPRWGANMQMLRRRNSPAFDFWTDESDTNIWEHCGLFEGDIMLHRELLRNGLLNERLTWPDATVPFYIDPDDFDSPQMMTILKAFKEYHAKTCIRFRPYEQGDTNWIVFKGNYSGCWSSVGRRQGGQILNLNTPKCVTHGVVVHELLHALGFYHQQSATERDEYVKINWENILDGHAHNFNKYARTHITNFGVEYDYQSVMHYSSRAFSKNGKATIEPLDPYATLGQRKGLSEKDISKLNEMYENECNGDFWNLDKFSNYLDDLIDYFQNTLFG